MQKCWPLDPKQPQRQRAKDRAKGKDKGKDNSKVAWFPQSFKDKGSQYSDDEQFGDAFTEEPDEESPPVDDDRQELWSPRLGSGAYPRLQGNTGLWLPPAMSKTSAPSSPRPSLLEQRRKISKKA